MSDVFLELSIAVIQKSTMSKFCFSIDRGGTFTDVYATCPNGDVEVLKLLSEDPAYPDAPTEAIRRIIEQVNYDFFQHMY